MEHEGKHQGDRPIVAARGGKVVYETGDMEHGVWSRTVMGLIQTCVVQGAGRAHRHEAEEMIPASRQSNRGLASDESRSRRAVESMQHRFSAVFAVFKR